MTISEAFVRRHVDCANIYDEPGTSGLRPSYKTINNMPPMPSQTKLEVLPSSFLLN